VQKILTAAQMQAIDRRTIENMGIPGVILMENAGRGIFELMKAHIPGLAAKKVVVFAGKGNNGGDGFVIARHLHNLGSEVHVLLFGKRDALKNDAAVHARATQALGVPVREMDADRIDSQDHLLRHAHIFVDALFGTGLSQPASGLYQRAIDKINALEKFVVSVDLPSGIDADSGRLIGPHVKATLTGALALLKRSHRLHPAAGAMGEIHIVDIGIPRKVIEEEPGDLFVPDESDIKISLPGRPADSHKGSYGHVLVIAGARGKGGAAGLTALAALRMGCGLVTLALPAGLQKAMEFHPLEVMTHPLPETESGAIDASADETILELCAGKSAVALGPGLSTDPSTVKLLDAILPHISCPLVLDADGLNGLETQRKLLDRLKCSAVLTPHPKEMSRISGLEMAEILNNRVETARTFARSRSLVLVLKGSNSLIAFPDGRVFINPTGNPGMATGGSGDVLTGMIAGLIAQGMEPGPAAVAANYLHGLAGDDYARGNSQTTLIAGDLLRTLPETLKRILP